MREQERRLLRCITAIDDELILEADTARFRPRPWGGLIALAACLALVIALPGLLRPDQRPGNSGYSYTTAPETPGKHETAASEHEKQDDLEQGTDGTESPRYGEAAILGTESIGGLYLGMTMDEITELLGDAWNDWAEPYTGEDGFRRVCWMFDSGEPNKKSEFDLVLEMIDLGAGWQLNHITVERGCHLPLSRHNIAIGSSTEAVRTAYADGGVTDYEYGTSSNGETWAYYAVGGDWDLYDPAWSGLLFTIYNDAVTLITYGPWVIDDAPLGLSPDEAFLGGIMPGMTEDMVQTVLGEPAKVLEDSGDGLFRWCYEAMTVAFHSFDRTVSWVLALDGSGVSLNNGINFSTGQEEVARRYPGAYVTEGDPAVDKHDTRYTVEGDFITLTIETVKGSVTTLRLEDHRNPLLEALYADEIALAGGQVEGWLIVDAVDKAAKRIATILTISEPEPTDMPEGMPTAWLEFGSGAVVGLLGDDCAVVYSCDGPFDPDSNDNLTPHLSGRFEGLDDALKEARLNPTATWEETAEAPEAESAAP